MINDQLLNINNLKATLDDKIILDNFNISVKYDESHVLMGPNGVGKSTLAKILAGGYNDYTVSGNIIFDKCDLLSMSVNDLSLKGIFLCFQHPIEINGLSNFQFFKSIINVKRKHENLDPINNDEFLLKVKNYMDLLKIKEDFLYRYVNDGFSGGEKKKMKFCKCYY